jgi:DNA-binding NtrC family response regulator
MTRRRLLLIDDEKDFTEALGKRLKLRNMQVDTASSGKEALKLAETHEYDVALLDLSMPGWDGLDTMKHLKSASPDLQVILLTGCATVRNGVDAMKLGAVDVLEKPADFNELLFKIEEAGKVKDKLVVEQLDKSIEDITRKHGW